MTFELIRQKHPRFIYEGFTFEREDQNLKIKFGFLIDPDIAFFPEVIFPNVSDERLQEIGKEALDNLVFNLGMAEALSYWKVTCSPEIIIRAGTLSSEQVLFWNNLLMKGLGEFYFTNNIDFTQPNFASLKFEEGETTPFMGDLKPRDLVAVGGGKDSAVTLSIFQEAEKNFTPLILSTETDGTGGKTSLNIIEVSGSGKPIIVKRLIDPRLLDLNKQGYLNGHTPFSAYLGFVGTLAAVLYNYKSFVVSNEFSASEGNMEYHGTVINHQYSKSLEYEKEFDSYARSYLAGNSLYYSFLRPLNELQIAKLFSEYPKYHSLFRSCNKGSKEGIWCCNCSKCLFAYLCLYPFLGKKLIEIFGEDLFAKEGLKGFMEELLQIPGKFKPFECVGTKEEVEYALFLSMKKVKEEKRNMPYLLKEYKSYAKNNLSLLEQWGDENLLPEGARHFLKRRLNKE